MKMNSNDDARIGLFEKVITEGATDENGNLLDICEMIKRKKEESVGG